MSGDLNLTDALVYSALYSRTTLSEKNGWIDEDGHIYIFYSIENLSEDLRKGQTVIKAALRKLTAAGLIETKRNFGAPNTIYVKLPNGRNTAPQSVGIPTTNYKSRTIRVNNKERTKPARQKYGSYGNVFLTAEEYQKLRKDIPNIDSLIEQLSTYMESKGKRYNNHAATLRNWAARDKSRQKPPRSGGLPDYSYKDGESL